MIYALYVYVIDTTYKCTCTCIYIGNQFCGLGCFAVNIHHRVYVIGVIETVSEEN